MHERFHYASLDEVRAEAARLGLDLPLSQNLGVLRQPLDLSGHTLANRLTIQPMEGCDGTAAGAPDELTQRRYERFALSGASLLWFEAIAVVPEGRANPRQLYMHAGSVDAFRALNERVRSLAEQRFGFAPLLIAQLTHSGRYSKPEGKPAPLIGWNNPYLEGDKPLASSCILSDDDLAALPERFAQAARLSERAGFDGADIKCCHRYLLSELLSCRERPGRYGGSLENRMRLLRECVLAAKAAVSPGFLITCRLNLHDHFPYPYGFGVSQESGEEPDLSESKRVVSLLHEELGLELLDFTIGNPYSNPHVNRPYDLGAYRPPEHPFQGLQRMMDCVGQVKAAFPSLKVIGSAFSYLRQFSGNLAAGAVERGVCDLAGFGRMAFAYPQFAADLLEKGALEKGRCCVACGKCTALMRAGGMAGCVVRDPLYTREYKQLGL